jgi:hypothetical protein
MTVHDVHLKAVDKRVDGSDFFGKAGEVAIKD